MDLPEEWGMPLGWSLAFVPVLLIIFGFIFHLLWKSRGMPFKMVSATCLYILSDFLVEMPTSHNITSLIKLRAIEKELIKIYGFFSALETLLQAYRRVVRERAPRAHGPRRQLPQGTGDSRVACRGVLHLSGEIYSVCA